jgi:hypothetical protein
MAWRVYCHPGSRLGFISIASWCGDPAGPALQSDRAELLDRGGSILSTQASPAHPGESSGKLDCKVCRATLTVEDPRPRTDLAASTRSHHVSARKDVVRRYVPSAIMICLNLT